VIGIGLMALVFYSSRAGYDQPPRLIENDVIRARNKPLFAVGKSPNRNLPQVHVGGVSKPR